MSALTKVFVVLLVVCSLLLSAGVVVFVNRVDDFKKIADKNAAEAMAAQARARSAEDSANAMKANLEKANTELNNQLADKDTALAAAKLDVAKAASEKAELTSKIGQQALALAQVGEALKASEAQKSDQAAQLVDLRTGVDKLTSERADLNRALTVKTNEYDAINRQYRFSQEQLTEAQSQISKLTGQVKDLGGQPTAAVGGIRAGAPAINGVIREVRSLDGIPYATISVGTADGVTKNMEFKIIDRNTGSFLGVLTVEQVEAKEAAGRLQGPRVQDIRAQNEARTQL